ncbi:N-acetylmuramoyl-L-alanine amidase [Dysgonomonas sp. 520]|uniref:N-acetylmuramoyl-L-alanine amidase family protein n=1 Tax=Dysgonomonas sp. 520 TaxID=2302931 RepID=UPI0013D797B2|nr:N-acetylmuramoyl-L-alanine amidase [Dysgonomonas sp. 520]NDW10758.1 N-acetylmuramoyl-L-alanine amidase [Dysgonomonas sp. 520]
MKYFLTFIFSILFCVSNLFAQKFVVVIDAGHGGKDPGAVRGKYKEKDINLAVALQLGKYINSKYKDTKVVYTRTSDTFVGLDKRASIANKAKANLFISIHVNATETKTTTAVGVETYILGIGRTKENLEVAKRENDVILLEDDYTKKYQGFDPKSPESSIIFENIANRFLEQSHDFANIVQREMSGVAKRKNIGVKQGRLIVLWKTTMPSVLVELGFINNSNEATYMSSQRGQRALASALFSAFENYKANFERKQGTGKEVQVLKEEKKANNTDSKLQQPDEDVVTENKPEKKEDKAEIKKEEKKSKENSREIKNGINNFIIKKVKDPQNTTTTTTKSDQNESVTKPAKKEEKILAEKKVNADEPIKQTDVKKKNETPNKPDQAANKMQIAKDQVEYRVQFFISTTPVASDSNKFKGLTPVDSYKDGGAYKYTYGSTTDFNEILRIQRKVRAKFPDAFVVKFKNGVRIK